MLFRSHLSISALRPLQDQTYLKFSLYNLRLLLAPYLNPIPKIFRLSPLYGPPGVSAIAKIPAQKFGGSLYYYSIFFIFWPSGKSATNSDNFCFVNGDRHSGQISCRGKITNALLLILGCGNIRFRLSFTTIPL